MDDDAVFQRDQERVWRETMRRMLGEARRAWAPPIKETEMTKEDTTKIAAFVGDGGVHLAIGTGDDIKVLPLEPAAARLLASQLLQAARAVDPQGHADAAMALAREGMELLATMQPGGGTAKH